MTPIPTVLDLERIAAPAGAPFAAVLVVTDRDGTLCAVDFAGYEARLERLLERRFGACELRPAAARGAAAARIADYLAGDLGAVDALPVKTRGTVFQDQAWLALRAIRAGSTATYGEQAARIGRPRAVRAVGAANGQNPIAIVLPCHRVVGGDGALTGYAGGLDTKRWLLAHEHRWSLPAARRGLRN